MNNFTNGIVAGFVATTILSFLMVMKGVMGIMPALDAIKMLTVMSHDMAGIPESPVVGWGMHFMIGAVLWGGLFAVLNGFIPAEQQRNKGIVFSVIAWLLIMIMVMPMAGAGLFGLKIGMMAPVATLMLHLIFGAVLGSAYGKLGSAQ